MEIDPAEFPWQSLYKLMIGAIVPRPIGWISSVDSQGQPNLAPFSFFNAVCPNPPTLLFCPMVRTTDLAQKDTLKNIRETGEFVVNIVSEPLLHAMNISSTEFPAGVNEFAAGGLTAIPSVRVRPPRVGESLIQFECRLNQIVEIGSEPGGGNVVIGTIVYAHAADDVVYGGDKVDLARLQPVGRLAGSMYCRVTDLFSLDRPASQVQPPSERHTHT